MEEWQAVIPGGDGLDLPVSPGKCSWWGSQSGRAGSPGVVYIRKEGEWKRKQNQDTTMNSLRKDLHVGVVLGGTIGQTLKEG